MANRNNKPPSGGSGPRWLYGLRCALEGWKLAVSVAGAYGATHLLHEWGVIGDGATGYVVLALLGLNLTFWFVTPARGPGAGVTINVPAIRPPRRQRRRVRGKAAVPAND